MQREPNKLLAGFTDDELRAELKCRFCMKQKARDHHGVYEHVMAEVLAVDKPDRGGFSVWRYQVRITDEEAERLGIKSAWRQTLHCYPHYNLRKANKPNLGDMVLLRYRVTKNCPTWSENTKPALYCVMEE